jgi:hypothetical protein
MDQAVAADSANPSRPSQMAADPSATSIIPPPLRYRGNLDLSSRPSDPDPRELEFPIPPSLDGFKAPVPSRTDAAKKVGGNQPQTPKKPQAIGATKGSGTPAPSRAAALPAPKSSADGAKAREQTSSDDDSDAPKKPTKPVKIDPKFLEMMLQRNIGR